MAELNGLEPSSAWLTTKCLTSRPQFRKKFRVQSFGSRVETWRYSKLETGYWKLVLFWVDERELNPCIVIHSHVPSHSAIANRGLGLLIEDFGLKQTSNRGGLARNEHLARTTLTSAFSAC